MDSSTRHLLVPCPLELHSLSGSQGPIPLNTLSSPGGPRPHPLALLLLQDHHHGSYAHDLEVAAISALRRKQRRMVEDDTAAAKRGSGGGDIDGEGGRGTSARGGAVATVMGR